MGINLGNSGGKIASGNNTIKSVDNTKINLTLNGFGWVVSISSMSPEVQRLITSGYNVNLYYVRCVPGGSKTHFNRVDNFLDTPNHVYTGWKLSNIYTNITSQIQSNPSQIEITDWLNTQLIGVLSSNKEFRSKALELYYTDYGWWFRRFKLVLVINNVKYGESEVVTSYLHCPVGQTNLIDFSATEYFTNEIHLYT